MAWYEGCNPTARTRLESCQEGRQLVIRVTVVAVIGLVSALAACGSSGNPTPGATQPSDRATQSSVGATQSSVGATPSSSCVTQVLSHDSKTLVQYLLTGQAESKVIDDLKTVLTGNSAAALATLQADATKLETDAQAAAAHPPPACGDPAGFEQGMQDLVTAAKDCMSVVNDLRSGNHAAAITQAEAVVMVLNRSSSALGKFSAALGAPTG